MLFQAEPPLIDPSSLPSSLYEKTTEIIRLPPSLAGAYSALIARYALLPLRQQRGTAPGPFGGPSREMTDIHFAQAFDGSCARAQLALLNPKRSYSRVANAFVEALSGNSVCIVDAPCGAGAAGLTFLACIAELRAQGVLPRQPLEVRLIGAELSEPARNYAAAILEHLRPSLEFQAIDVKHLLLHWDVLDPVATRNVIQEAVLQSSSPTRKRFLIVANFSGFLKHGTHRSDAGPQIDNLFLHMSGPGNIALWIEPSSNAARRLLEWLVERAKRWSRFATVYHLAGELFPAFDAKAFYQRPLTNEGLGTAHLSVLRIELQG